MSPTRATNSSKQKTILVTGAAGFLGSHICDALLEKGQIVIGVDNYNTYYDPIWKKENIASVQEQTNKRSISAKKQGNATKFHMHTVDIVDEEQLKKVFKQHDITSIIHLAARAGVRPSIENPHLYEEVNVHGTLNILNLARRHRVKELVIASSSSVYGINTKTPYAETDVIEKQISPYAVSKRILELMCQCYHHLYQQNIACLRFFTVYGPRGRPDMAPYKFTKALLEDRPITRFGDGSTQRDYTFVKDIIAGTLGALGHLEAQTKLKKPVCEIINLGNNKPIELKSFIGVIESATGKKAQIEQLPEQPGDVPITFADISKAGKLFDYDPQTNIEEGMKEFVAWYEKERHEERT